ncbi:MAG: peptidase M50, partial [Acidobacteriaceae bacterium]
MRAWSLPLGRWFGVHLRIHYFFLLLLLFCLLSTNFSGISAWRGIFLWFLLFGAVLGREAARAMTAAWHGLAVRSILLLPIGGLFSYSSPDMAERAVEGSTQWALTLAGPISNLAFAALVAALIEGATSQVPIVTLPLVTAAHLMRSIVWLNVALALINFIPAYPLDAGRLVRSGISRTRGVAQATRAASGLGQMLG